MNCIYYGEQAIRFIRKSHKAQKVKIQIKPNGEVWVFAPVELSEDELKTTLQKRSRWIMQKLQNLPQNPPLARQYLSGESHFYLGRRYQLKVLENQSVPVVSLKQGQLTVSVKAKSAVKIQKVLNQWYRKRAEIIFAKRLTMLAERTLWLTEIPQIRLRTMKTQWGNCSPFGAITLNPNLVKAPTECIDYVILHELCHLVHHNHSPDFYRLMTQVMPNWRDMKMRLEKRVTSGRI
ncbi:M48 family metallopeptidase [Actinobacillus vicugnae]|uniref:M48 family metallopeptidase n=1 Tax=Actinobacillus vicugnae TaxID=2573093 RepID=UPI0012406201|nr:SprT family zinc-dependent metalloprotease [Actinobacillus vicugnae]